MRPFQSKKSDRGLLITILGFMGLFCGCGPCGIIAWVMGNSDLTEIRMGIRDDSGKSLTKLGKAAGMISTILGLTLIVVSALIWFILIGTTIYKKS